MSEKWERARLGDLVETQKGYAFKSGWYCDTGCPIVRVSDFTHDSVDSNSLVCIPGEIAADYSKYELEAGDVVVQTVGSWPSNPASVVGKCVRIPEKAMGALLNQNAVKLAPSKMLDQRFLFYLLRNEDFKTYIVGTAQGAASQAAITLDAIRAYEFDLPLVSVQGRLAGILSAYDELIEYNQRRIKILEEMARSFYREWFVHFRFPGHDKVKIVPSPLGPIPQGWEVKPLFDLAEVRYGRNLSTKNLVENAPYPVYGAAKIIGHYTEYTRERQTLICGCRGSVGEMQITQPQCFVTNNSFTFDPTHSDNFFWLFHTLKERGLRDVIGGAAQPQITLDSISLIELVTPPLPFRTHFQQSVLAMFEQAWTLESQIRNLRRTRDLLLPRLLSGEVAV